ncbi:MAG: flagellar basal body protein, partial [Betaproteobacteria bacterium]
MTDLLSIGANAVSNYQQALSTVSNNIANMNTDGYSRQVANIGENVDQRVGQFFVGTGAIFDGVTRAYDAFTQASVYSSYSSLNTQTPIAQ